MVRYRRAKIGDAKAINEICSSLGETYPLDLWKRCLNADVGSFVALEGDEIIGYVVTIDNDHPDVYKQLVMTSNRNSVANIAVQKTFWKTGVGSELLKRSIEIVDKTKPLELFVRESNLAARKLYKKYGFEEESDSFVYSDGGKGYKMVLNITLK